MYKFKIAHVCEQNVSKYFEILVIKVVFLDFHLEFAFHEW